MISKQSIALGELIAVGVDAPIKPGIMVTGLNQKTVGSFAYTDNFREEIVQTTQNTGHTEEMGVLSERLAEVIRESMYTIRDFGIPFANKLAERLQLRFTPDYVSDQANRNIFIKYHMLDNSFFTSPLFPTAVSDKSLDYSAINMDMLDQLKFNSFGNEEIMAYVGSNHPDITAALEDNDSLLDDCSYVLSGTRELGEMFERQGGVFNFKKVKCYDVNAVIRLYVLLTKMYASEDPPKWLVGGDLATYRRMVNLLWNGVTTNLLVIKELFQIYQARKVAVIGTKAPSIVPSNTDGLNVQLLNSGYTVLYTNDFMRSLDNQNISINDLIIGYGWSQVVGPKLTVVDMINNPSACLEMAKSYYGSVRRVMGEQSRKLFMESGLKAIAEFLNNTPVVAERFKEQLGNTTELPATWITKRFSGSLESAYMCLCGMVETNGNTLAVSDEKVDRPFFEAILASPLVSDFLKALGCTLAAEIVDATFINKVTDDNIHDKRQRLHVALIKLIVDKSIE